MRDWIERSWWSTSPSLAMRTLTLILTPLSAVYGWLYRRSRKRTTPVALPVPVVVVGNLVVGGAGKTPTTIALVKALQDRGWRPGVVSRGYGRADDTVLREVHAASLSADAGDEPLLIHRRTGAPTVVGRDRVAVAQLLVRQHPDVNVIVCDDGLQHHRLARDASVVVLDERGLGNGLLLPAGPLRERPTDVPPPRTVVVYNADAPTTTWQGPIVTRQLGALMSLSTWWGASNGASVDATSAARPAPRPGVDTIVAACGIAAPNRFFTQLRGLGFELVPCPLPDHFDWRTIPAIIHANAGSAIVITEKDAVKLAPTHPLASRVFVAPLDFHLPESSVTTLLAWLVDAQARRHQATMRVTPSPAKQP